MARSSESKSSVSKYYLYTALLTGVYCLLTFFSPIDPASQARFNLSVFQLRLLQLSIVVPIVAIWFTATYGAAKFKAYAEKIKDAPDGKALNQVANGLLVLVYVSLVGSSLFSSLSSYARAAGMRVPFTITNRYVSLTLGLIAFTGLFMASTHVLKVVKAKQKAGGLLAFVGVGSLAYIYAQMTYPYRNSTPDPQKYSSSYLPDPLIIATILLPTIASWVLGALAAANITAYKEKSKGIIYKQALTSLSRGIIFIIFFSISLQLLTGLSEYFSTLGLQGILVLLYAILVLYAVGWVIIARGASKLTKIEEVV